MMADVERFTREFQEVIYTVGPETIRKAVLSWLEDKHGAAFTGETTITFCSGNSMDIVTRFECENKAEDRMTAPIDHEDDA